MGSFCLENVIRSSCFEMFHGGDWKGFWASWSNAKFSLLVNRIFGLGKIDGRPCRVTRVQVCGCVLDVQSPRCGADNETVCVELIRRKPGRADVVVNAR